MQEVEIGQIYSGGILVMEVKVIHEDKACVLTKSGLLTTISLEALVKYELVGTSDTSSLSDLEIVQKALLKTDQYVDLMGDGRWYVCDKYMRSNGPSGEDNASLLAWAKQIIGVE